MMKLKKTICGILVIVVIPILGTSILVSSKDEVSITTKCTVSGNKNDFTTISEEEQLAEMIEFYRAKVKDFNPTEGEITTYKELFAYLDTLPGHISFGDLEEGESRLAEVLDDGSKIYVVAVPTDNSSNKEASD